MVAVGVVLFVGIIWIGTGEEPIARRVQAPAVTEIAVVVQAAPPLNTRASVATPFTWAVGAPVGHTATHTAIHWGTASRTGALGLAVAPADSGYPSILADYASGSFALPREFSGAVTFPSAGIYYYRAHAIIDGKHYWSSEYTIRVE